MKSIEQTVLLFSFWAADHTSIIGGNKGLCRVSKKMGKGSVTSPVRVAVLYFKPFNRLVAYRMSYIVYSVSPAIRDRDRDRDRKRRDRPLSLKIILPLSFSFLKLRLLGSTV